MKKIVSLLSAGLMSLSAVPFSVFAEPSESEQYLLSRPSEHINFGTYDQKMTVPMSYYNIAAFVYIDNYDNVKTSRENDYDIDVPKGFKITSEGFSENGIRKSYKSGNDTISFSQDTFTQYPNHEYPICHFLMNEGYETEYVTDSNGVEFLFLTYETKGETVTSCSWSDSEYLFEISSNSLTQNELIDIFYTLKPVEKSESNGLMERSILSYEEFFTSGDITGDGYSDCIDSALLLSFYAKRASGFYENEISQETIDYYLENGDIDNNGSVDCVDASLVMCRYTTLSTL